MRSMSLTSASVSFPDGIITDNELHALSGLVCFGIFFFRVILYFHLKLVPAFLCIHNDIQAPDGMILELDAVFCFFPFFFSFAPSLASNHLPFAMEFFFQKRKSLPISFALASSNVSHSKHVH